MNNNIEPRVPQFLHLVTIASKIITPIGVYILARFEATLDFSRSEFN